MERNYRFPSSDRWRKIQNNNQPFGGRGSYFQQYMDQTSAFNDYGPYNNMHNNSSEQEIRSDNQPYLLDQWLNRMFETRQGQGQLAADNSCNQIPPPPTQSLTNTQSSVYENLHLKIELLTQKESWEYRNKLETREKLPVMRQKNAVLQSIREHQIVLIVGEKGCGKSSQVPQLVLDDYILDCRGSGCRIVCSGLTKLEAEQLAERVAYERNEAMGISVGFQGRRESLTPRSYASILYCTNEILTKELSEDPLLKKFNICILDKTHEINSNTSHIMERLKLLLPHRSDLKIILLSNSVEDSFCEYFRNYHVLFIHGTSSLIDLTADDESEQCLSSSDDIAPSAQDRTARETAKPNISKVQYRTARAFFEKYKQVDPATLTEWQKQMMREHQQTMENYKCAYPSKKKKKAQQQSGCNNMFTQSSINPCESSSTSQVNGVPIKRTISMDEPIEQTRSRFGDTDEDKKELDIAVIDMSDDKGRISADKWLVVESKLISDMTSENLSNDQISFDSVNWYRGIKVITCHNEASLDFLKTAIDEICRMWPNVNLKVVPRSSLPTYTYATVWIPPPIPPIEKVLQLIKKQNVGLNTEKWKITPSLQCKKNFGKEFRLDIDNASTRHIREKQGKIKFGLGSLRIRIHRY